VLTKSLFTKSDIMKKVTLFIISMFIIGSVAMAQQNTTVMQRYDDIYTPSVVDVQAAPAVLQAAHWTVPTKSVQTLLYDNGSFVNGPAQGSGGKDASIVENSTLLMSLYGSGIALSSGYRCADDFVVPANEQWIISEIDVFGYQTGSTATSTFNAVNFKIWSGMPPSGTVVWGDGTTNLMTSSVWTNCYRVLETDLLGATRPIMKNISTLTSPVTLGPGHYWLDWQEGGTGTSGPWANPIAVLGQSTTGDARQYVPTTTTWQAVRDTGSTSSLGLPFLLQGTLIAGINNPANVELSVYPNPAKDFVRVNSNAALIDRLSMMNTLGQVVFEATPGLNKYEISLSTYERGLYTISVETQKGQKNFKVILD